MHNDTNQQLPWITAAFGPDDEGCDHGDYSEDSNADSADTDSGSSHSDGE